ncbi:Uncharacterised protein [Acinetobacter baumannii]|nr:Uncharacterised protein [Acinetobacter baumannii]
MNFIEKAKKDIENNWFENHVAEIKGEEGLQVIYWGEPGTNMYRTKYVLSGNNVFISGDIGEAVYSLTCLASLENIKDFDLSYFTGKLTAFCDERYDFDDAKAKKELKEFWKEYDMHEIDESKAIYDGVMSAIDESTNMNQYHGMLMMVYHDTSLESDTLEYLWDLGERMPYRLIGYWVGLQMAIKQLENNASKTA